jgi:tryptophan 2,3-dioxygenase
LLFIIIRQTYELRFKQLLHEIAQAQRALESGNTHYRLSLLGRIRTIMKICLAQIDILETMTPLKFNSFRARLESASGFQSAQFREFEAVLGRRDTEAAAHLDPEVKSRVEQRMRERSLWESVLRFIVTRGFAISESVINRDVTIEYEGNVEVQKALLELHQRDPGGALICERLVDIDEGLQEWRYRHVKMVERTIGHKMGTGGSSGVGYLASRLFKPIFPDLWEIRSSF